MDVITPEQMARRQEHFDRQTIINFEKTHGTKMAQWLMAKMGYDSDYNPKDYGEPERSVEDYIESLPKYPDDGEVY